MPSDYSATSAADLARTIASGERAGFNTTEHMRNARLQADERGLDDYYIVDTDAHHYETEAWADIVKYIEDPVLRHRAQGQDRHGRPVSLYHSAQSNQHVSGRIVRYPRRRQEEVGDDVPRDVALIRREMESIGIDVQIVFPTPMLQLGLNPDTSMEAQLSWAYSRWLTEEILPHDTRIRTMIYLPLNDVQACLRMIDKFGDAPGVVGFMVASGRHKPVHDNSFAPIYRELEERGLPVGFHAIYNDMERIFEGMNKFISVHSLGFVLYNMVHLTNMIMNGIPERFPKLKVVWIESGLAWLPFLAQRLDNEYMMRTSEAPLLKKLPSDYIRENFYYTTQPMETGDIRALEQTFRMIGAETQLMYSSDYPHWDFNLPSTIFDLPFLSDQAKRQILGENARRVFNL
ncbi:amidohydrolase family protein [Microbacterium sp. SYP-A9085]|uniref:amidohydrolase family protein n=1 Tax=Microbacterium sp. SYP-A9085 TaxID=2664454 RepID=UPI00129A9C8B|nr:amidohydrolase family protein [Microbacterium sp. SYP-A9085]MRH28001.1 amidohydrolase family protein [Microbacterium sp. SYP-A9085]